MLNCPNKLVLKDSDKVRQDVTIEQKKKIRKMYSALAKQIADDAKKYEGKDNISSIMRQTQLHQLEKSIKQTSKDMYSEIKKEVESGMKQIAEAVVSDNIKWGKSMGLDIKTAFAYVPKDVVTSITTGNVYDSGWNLSKRIWSDNQKLLQDVHSVVAKGIAANMTTYEIAKDLEKYVDPSAKKDWKWSKVYPGTNKQVDYNAQRLARTLSNHAFQQAFVRTTKNNPFVEAYKWNTGHNHKTCQICINLAQTDQYGLGQGVFPKDKLPLDHPNGYCLVTAVIKKSTDDIANEIADWVNGKQNEELDKYAKSMGLGSPSTVKGLIKKNKAKEEKQKEIKEKHTKIKSNVKPFNKEEWLKKLNYNSRYEMTKIINDNFDKWYEKISPDELSGVRTYTGSFYEEMNGVLRGVGSYSDDKLKAINLQIENCKSALNKASSPELIVRRGSNTGALTGLTGKKFDFMSETLKEDIQILKGKLVEDKGFFSTTPYVDGGFGGKVNYIIKVPEGSKGVYVDSISRNKGEQEFLLNCGSKFIIEHVEIKGTLMKKADIYMRLLKDDE